MTQTCNVLAGIMLDETPSQTAGPYVHIGCLPNLADIAGIYEEDLGKSPIEEGAKGEVIAITGSVFDGTGWALRDCMFESWQADSTGLYSGQPGADPKVSGFCRFAADGTTGEFQLTTIKPGPVTHRSGTTQAPHISLMIFARGINNGLHTRIYFDDEDNSADPLLARIEQRPRVETLMAKKTGARTYRFDICLQGTRETVFLDM